MAILIGKKVGIKLKKFLTIKNSSNSIPKSSNFNVDIIGDERKSSNKNKEPKKINL